MGEVRRTRLSSLPGFRQRGTQLRREVVRLFGLSLGGGKTDRTALVILDFYVKQQKTFIVDVYEAVGGHDDISADEAILQTVFESLLPSQLAGMIFAFDSPIQMPPCAQACESTCQSLDKCKRPAVVWMHKFQKKLKKKAREFTPYTQRPVDYFFRNATKEDYQSLGVDHDKIHQLASQAVPDETLGANQAPKAARAHYLLSKIRAKLKKEKLSVIEVWPKLSLLFASKGLKVKAERILHYRGLEDGLEIREIMLAQMAEYSSIFVYERDQRKIVDHIPAFDAFITSWVALLSYQGKSLKWPKDLPTESGWIEIPSL